MTYSFRISCFMGFFLLLVLVIQAQQHKPDIQHYIDAHNNIKTVKTENDWAKKKSQVLLAMQDVMGKLPEKDAGTPEVKYIDTLETPYYNRYTISLSVYQNEHVPCLLYIPKSKAALKKYSAVLALHSTGDKGKHLVDSFSAGPYRAVATELVHRGYIVLAPDYPGFGDLATHNFKQDRYESGTMQGIFNHMRCIDYLQSRTDVDKDRIGVIGHSLGGHNAIFLAAFDERLKIVVSSCGWTLMTHYNAGKDVTERFGGTLGPWAQDRYMPYIRDKYKLDAELLPFDFDEVIACIAPRYFFSNSPIGDGNFNVEGVMQGIANTAQVFNLLKVPNHLQVYYPEAGHDFPNDIRQKAYEEMDKVLK